MKRFSRALALSTTLIIGAMSPSLLSAEDTYNGLETFLPLYSVWEQSPDRFLEKPNQEITNTTPINRERGEAQPIGALTGASIFLSPGHGWYSRNGTWTTQRSNSYGVLEDHSNAETVIQYLLPLLWNAGANVYTVRERDMQTNEVIVSRPELEGEWTKQNLDGTWDGDQYVAMSVRGTESSVARFTPDIPEAGYYAVYAWYRSAGDLKTTDQASFSIRHTGGETTWVQDQNRDGHTWKYMGRYYFEKGKNADTGSVVVTNSTGSKGDGVVVDAIRFGGGMGSIPDPETGETSGKPRWEESGFPYAQFMGFDPTTTGEGRRWNQVHAMPRYAEWEAEEWEKGRTVFVSWHTNASLTHKISGISSYIYGVDGWDGVENFSGYPGSTQLAYYTHNQILKDVRNWYDPAWGDVGIITRWLGETNVNSNGKMPAVLLENGFHDNPDDAIYITDPNFRSLSARAAYKGLVSYYSNMVDGFEIDTILPETPPSFAVETDGDGVARLTWTTPPYDTGEDFFGDPADHYRVYTSTNGYGFDNGTIADDTEFVIEGLPTTRPTYFRVAAVNEGGESLPSETLAVLPDVEEGVPRMLIISAYDRLDSGLNFVEESGAQRGILSKMNDRNYAIQTSQALTQIGYAHDSASNEAVAQRLVSLLNYDVVIWMLGNEDSKTAIFDQNEQQVLREYMAAGGKAILSGSNIAESLSYSDRDLAFSRDVLGIKFQDNAENGTSIIVQGAEMNQTITIPLSDGTGNFYPALSTDVMFSLSGAESLISYEGLAAGSAALGTESLVVAGFPLETVKGKETRRVVLEIFLWKLGLITQ